MRPRVVTVKDFVCLQKVRMVTPWNICLKPIQAKTAGMAQRGINQPIYPPNWWNDWIDMRSILVTKIWPGGSPDVQEMHIQGWYNAESHISGAPISLLLGPSCWNLRFCQILVTKFRGKILLQFQVAFAKVPPPQPTDLPVKEVGLTWIWRAEGQGGTPLIFLLLRLQVASW